MSPNGFYFSFLFWTKNLILIVWYLEALPFLRASNDTLFAGDEIFTEIRRKVSYKHFFLNFFANFLEK